MVNDLLFQLRLHIWFSWILKAAPADLFILVVGAVVKILPYTVIILRPLLLAVCHLHQITLSYMLVYLTGTHLAKRWN